MAEASGTAAWISVLASAVLALIGAAGWVKWCRLTGNEGFVLSIRATLGRTLGDAVMAFLIVAYLVWGSWNIRGFIGGAVIGLVPEFPIDILLYIFVLAALYASWLGLEPVARTGALFFPPTLFSIFLVAIGMYRSFDLKNLSPLWGFGVKNTLVQGLLNTGSFGAIPALAVMKSYVRKHGDLARAGVQSVLLAAGIMAGTILAVAAVFPYPMSARKIDPLGIMARAVYLGRFFQRLEAFFTFTWFFAAAVQASFTYLIVLILISQLCGARTMRPYVPAVAVLTFGVAGLPANTLSAGRLLESIVTAGAGNVMVALGWILFFVAKARGIKATPGAQQNTYESSAKGREDSGSLDSESNGPS